MKPFGKRSRARSFDFSRRAVALFAALALLSQSLFVLADGSSASKSSDAKAKLARQSDEERIVHVLNRLAFGPRPGDVERVRRMGVERYIEEQLNPMLLDDKATEARLKGLSTLTMSNGELLAKFPNPGMLIRQLQRRGELPEDLALVAEAFRPNNQRRQQSDARMNAKTESGETSPVAMENQDANRNEYRRAILRYMRENGMEPPARIMAELQASRVLRAVYSERQLQEVMVDFWSNHFNVFAGKGADRWYLTSYDRDVIRPNALGNFRELLEATAKSPAMLFYLDNFQSVSPNARMRGRGAGLRSLMGADGEERRMNRERGGARRPERMNGEDEGATTMRRQPQRMRRGINENYARELLELHTLGVDGGYTQKDVQEVARAFTGWTIVAPRGYGAREGLERMAGSFAFVPRLHDAGEKLVLGQKIPAGGGIEDGQKVLDVLVKHPSTAKFIAAKLARRFVSDDPPEALVERVAQAFAKSDGDIKETLRALFASPEFNAAEARRAKIKTPFELAVSALRALDAETNGGAALNQWLARMGEGLYLYQAPTGYPDTAEHWVSTGGLLERLNFSLALVGNRIPGTRVNLSRFVGDAASSQASVDRRKVVNEFAALMLQGDMSEKSRAVLLKQLDEETSDAKTAAPSSTSDDKRAEVFSMSRRNEERSMRGGRRARMQTSDLSTASGNPEVARIAALILGSPEFQRQ